MPPDQVKSQIDVEAKLRTSKNNMHDAARDVVGPTRPHARIRLRDGSRQALSRGDGGGS